MATHLAAQVDGAEEHSDPTAVLLLRRLFRLRLHVERGKPLVECREDETAKVFPTAENQKVLLAAWEEIRAELKKSWPFDLSRSEPPPTVKPELQGAAQLHEEAVRFFSDLKGDLYGLHLELGTKDSDRR